MSLKEAYNMAHSAECRLQMAANQPDRNLRFVVGHLMHYESLRLRIVEIEHDISMSGQASDVRFIGTGHVGSHTLQVQRKPSTGQLRQRSPPPPPNNADDLSSTDSDDSGEFADEFDDEASGVEQLVLQRFPSASSREPRPSGHRDGDDKDLPPANRPPPLEADVGADADDDDEDEEDDDGPPSPGEPDRDTLARITKEPGDSAYADMYNRIKKCPCHDHQSVEDFSNVWVLPQGADGKMRAVAEIK